jgi:hypothetical protein
VWILRQINFLYLSVSLYWMLCRVDQELESAVLQGHESVLPGEASEESGGSRGDSGTEIEQTE